MIDIAVDVGSGLTKVQWSEGRAFFPSLSGAVEQSESFDYQEAEGAEVEFRERKFLVGEKAKLSVMPSQLENTLDDRWFESDAYLALFYTALSKTLPEDYSGKIHLCTGLPQAAYRACTEPLIERLAAKHTFRVNGKRYRTSIRREDLQVMPQVMGLFISQLRRDRSLQVQKVALIDVGTYTSDWTIVEDCKTAHWASGGMPVGIADVIRRIKEYLREDLGMTASDAAISRAIRLKKIQWQGKEVDLTNKIAEAAFDASQMIIEEVDKRWEGAKDATLIVGGGGGPLFGPAMRTHFAHARVVQDKEPFFSVVNGYYTYLTERRKQKAA